MSGYFDRLERELRAAVPRASALHDGTTMTATRTARRPIRLRPGVLPAAFGVAVTLLVVVLALETLGHGHGHAHSIPPAAEPAPRIPANPTAAPTLGKLLNDFAVLRRPQTAADRSWQPPETARYRPRRLPALTRLARTLPNGDRVFITVEQLRRAQAGLPASTYVVRAWVVDRFGQAAGAGYDATTGRSPVFPFEFATASQGSRGSLWTSLAPDGVGSVRWTFTCNRLVSCAAPSPKEVRVSTSDNVATADVAGAGSCDTTAESCLQPTAVVWFQRNTRNVLASYARPVVAIATPPPSVHVTISPQPSTSAAAQPAPRQIRDVLSARGVGTVAFGQPQATAVPALNRLLGTPGTAPTAYLKECGVDEKITWTDPRSAPAQPYLVAYLDKDRLVGYQYFADQGQRPPGAVPAHGTVLATTRGLTIRDTMTRGRRLYGSAFTFSAAQDGSWQLRTNSGRLAGFAWDPPRYGAVSPHALVTSIAAGDVGCPALAP
jgi:hypothetical protein